MMRRPVPSVPAGPGAAQVTAAWSRITGSPASTRGPPQVDRRRLRGLAEQRDSRLGHLGAARRDRVAGDDPGDRHDALLAAASAPRPRASGSRTTTWARPERSRHDEERHRPQFPAAVHPALDPDRAARSGRRQLSRQRTGNVRQRRCQDASPPSTACGPGGAGGARVAVPPHLRRREPASAAVTGPAARAGKVSSPAGPAVRLRSCRRLSERRDSPVTWSSVIARTRPG